MKRYAPHELHRCAGRFGLKPNDPVCERRQQCLRFIALAQHPLDEPIPAGIYVATGFCRDGTDWFIEGVA